MTNRKQSWSPARGVLQGGVLRLTSPELLATSEGKALEGKLHEDLLYITGGVVLRPSIEDFSGTWATASVWLGEPSSSVMLGTTDIMQNPNGNVKVENADQPWSPATGYVRGSVMTLESPPEMRGLTGTISGRQLTMSNGVTCYRTVPNFRGSWAVTQETSGEAAAALFQGVTNISQTEDVVTLTNPGHPWSPAAGTVEGRTVTLYAPAQLKGLKLVLRSGQLLLSNNIVLQRKVSDKQGSGQQYQQGLPKAEVLNIPLEERKMEDRKIRVNAKEYRLRPLNLGTEKASNIFDINLHEAEAARDNVERYYQLCKDYVGLQVTTSCFKIWRQSKKINGHAKVIPALKSAGNRDDVRIFFFDDNLEWEGLEKSSGICNLRDVATGEFVEFTEGVNGFKKEKAARNTVIHASTEYHNVLVKANILDAMEDPEYFSSIIARHALPSERIIVYMDVNSTILCNDSVQGKDLGATVLSTLMEFIELTPTAPFSLAFDTHPPVMFEKQRTLKQLVKEVTGDNHKAYSNFFSEDTCWRFFEQLASHGEMRWMGEGKILTLAATQQLFNHYLNALEKLQTKDGLAASWFRCLHRMRERDTMVLNSFGVDTRKVILATVPDESKVLQVTVNYAMWEDRDMKKYASQFTS